MTNIQKLSLTDAVDFAALLHIFQLVFEHENPKILDNQLLTNLLMSENFWVFVAKKENIVVGGLTVHLLPNYYEGGLTAYIYDVGVLPDFQGKGIGKQLITHLCEYCQAQGIQEAYVEAEAEDIDALQFYRKTAYSTELKAVHFTYNFDK